MSENYKPIIIDGVDVAGCQYLYFTIEDSIIDCKEYPRCSVGEMFTNNACKNSNCYFKQLARKTQECEHRKHQAELGSDTTDRLAKQLEEKEQECEELKVENQKLDNQINDLTEVNEEYSQINNHLNYMLGDVIAKVLKDDDQEEYFYTELKEKFTNKLDEIVKHNDRYKQALEKIESILDDYKHELDASMCSNVSDYILNIINEVKE